MKQPTIYIMASGRNGTLYTGVTSHLLERIYQHKQKETPGFTQKYGCTLLVFYEHLDTMEAAIAREKKIKAGSRTKKLALIEGANPEWRDLWDDISTL